MQPSASDIIIAHAPAEATLASYYAIALRTQGVGASPYSPPEGQSSQALAAQVRNSRALTLLVTDPAPAWATALLAGYRDLAATERWRRIAIVRRGSGQLSPEMQGLPWIEASDKPVEEVAAELLSLLGGAPPLPATGTGRPAPTQPATPAGFSGPPKWPADQPPNPSFVDGMMTRRALLIGGLGVVTIGAVALASSAVLTRGFGLFAAGSPTAGVVPLLLFTSSGNSLFAVDLAKGTIRWGFTADGNVRPAESALAGVIHAISERGTIYALDTGSGQQHWQASIPGPVFVRPVVANGIIYTGSDDHNVYALSTKDGSVVWKFQTGDKVESKPTVDNGVVYIGSADGNVYALGATDGKLKWKRSANGPVFSAAAIGNNLIYIGSNDRSIRAIHVEDGGVKWRFTTGGQILSSPAVAGDTVYVGSQDNGIYAIEADAPKMRWRVRTGGSVQSSPVVVNDTIFIGSGDHTIYALGTDGSKRWTFKAGDAVNGRLIAANGVVYASSDALYALDAAKGTLIWRFTANGKSGYFSPGISQ
jgi:outer membrane protein assembly factor BamB